MFHFGDIPTENIGSSFKMWKLHPECFKINPKHRSFKWFTGGRGFLQDGTGDLRRTTLMVGILTQYDIPCQLQFYPSSDFTRISLPEIFRVVKEVVFPFRPPFSWYKFGTLPKVGRESELSTSPDRLFLLLSKSWTPLGGRLSVVSLPLESGCWCFRPKTVVGCSQTFS